MTILQQDMPLQSHEVSQLYAIFTALPTGVLLLDGAGVITRANPAALSLLGEPLEGELWRQVIARCFEPREDDGHEISLRDGRRSSSRPSPCRISPASWCSSTISPRPANCRIASTT